MVICDYFTKIAHLVPLQRRATAEDIGRAFFKEVVRLHGLPDTIVSDHDSKFTSAFWQQLWKECDTKFNISIVFHPQTDGLVERLNRTLVTIGNFIRQR